MTKLKKIRVIVALLFFFTISLIFLDYINVIPSTLYEYVLWLQFIPSLTKFVNTLTISAVGFLVILLSVLFFGRVYCSSVCPLGTLQDFISRVSQKLFGVSYFNWSEEHKWIRYTILIFSILSIPLIGMFIIGLLDPFSNFGRILTNLFYPVIILLNNLLSSVFESIGLYLI
ncbi:MAG: 4Fe-4S binding protein, partial [Ignavibacteriaceae bacterium]